MKNIKDIWNKKSELFASIEVIRKQGEPDIYNSLLLERTQSSLIILEKKEGLDNISDFSDFVKKKIPVVLTISGSGVLLRKLEREPSLDKNQITTTILPNSDPDEFILQLAENKSAKLFCSLIRKNIVEEICTQFIDYGIFVLDVGIGIFSISSLASLFDTDSYKLNTQEYKLQFKDRDLVDFTKLKHKQNNLYRLGSIEIEGDFLVGFANAFKYFILESRSCSLDILLDQKLEFYNYKRIKVLTKVLAFSLFFILIINYALQYNLTEKIRKVDANLYASRALFNEFADLQNSLKQKKEVVSALGIGTESYVSLIIDKMAQELPTQITLSELTYNPRIKKARKGKLFSTNTLLVKGKSTNVEDLNAWITKIEKMEKVNSVKLSDYLYLKKEGLASFDLMISIVD